MKLFTLLALPAALLLGVVSITAAEAPKGGKFWVFVGTGGGKAKGIYRFELDAATGKPSDVQLASEADNPNFLAIHPSGQFLYAVGAIEGKNGKKESGVMAFALDRASGKLKLLNGQPSAGGGPCHIVLDKDGKNALIANYGGGSSVSLPISADGKLAPAASVMQHKGGSVNKTRQQAPHAHSINLDPANRFAFVADLGLDQVLVYKFDAEKGTLAANDPPHATVAPGAGPRHFAFHPSGKFAYVINEIGNTVTVFDYDATKGVLAGKQNIATLPTDFKGTSYTAEVVVHPNGKFLYGSNRGHNSIAVFTIDQKTGELTPTGHQGKDIKTPRNFAIDPTGQWLLVGNQDSNSVVIFRIDLETGKLLATDHKVDVPTPICVRFLAKDK